MAQSGYRLHARRQKESSKDLDGQPVNKKALNSDHACMSTVRHFSAETKKVQMLTTNVHVSGDLSIILMACI